MVIVEGLCLINSGLVVAVAVGGINDAHQRTFAIPINYLINLLAIVPVSAGKNMTTSSVPETKEVTVAAPEKLSYWKSQRFYYVSKKAWRRSGVLLPPTEAGLT